MFMNRERKFDEHRERTFDANRGRKFAPNHGLMFVPNHGLMFAPNHGLMFAETREAKTTLKFVAKLEALCDDQNETKKHLTSIHRFVAPPRAVRLPSRFLRKMMTTGTRSTTVGYLTIREILTHQSDDLCRPGAEWSITSLIGIWRIVAGVAVEAVAVRHLEVVPQMLTVLT